MTIFSFANVSSQVLTVLYLINILFTITIVFLERKQPMSTLVWILALFILPGIGALLYILLSQNILRRKELPLEAQDKNHQDYHRKLLAQIRNMQAGIKKFHDPRIEPYQDLIHFHHILSRSLLTEDNDIHVFTDGKEKFGDLFHKIAEAKNHIHVLYYILKKDALGYQLLELLIKKAQEGVEVRLLIDAIGNKMPLRDLADLTVAGGRYALFFPSFFTYINLKLNYRNHRKIVVIDGQIGYVGGFNVGNEYIGLKKRMGYWRDTHLRIQGSAVLGLQACFFKDWLLAAGERILYEKRYYPPSKSESRAGVQIVSSGPDSSQQEVKYGYLKMINSARRSIYIQTPYFIPDESIGEALKIAALSGVDVRIMIPCKPDHPFVFWATYSFIGELLQAGVKAYIYTNGFLHSKMIVVDKTISSVGTANFDIRSFRLNYEVNAFLYDVLTSKKLHDAFLKDIAASEEVTVDRYQKRSFLVKFKESISRLLAPIL